MDVTDPAWMTDETVGCCHSVIQAARTLRLELPIFLYRPLDCPKPLIQELMLKLDFSLLQGIVIGEALPTSQGDEIGKTGKAPTLEILRFIKESAGFEGKLIATAGVHEPLDAIELMCAGADYI
jgi:dihydroorotate dehydrogenase